MPNLTQLPALDVAIGLVLVFASFALVVSGIGELIARVLSWRSKFLEEGLRNLLDNTSGDDIVKDVLCHPLVRGLRRHGTSADPRPPKLPSYLPSKAFATALFDTLVTPEQGKSLIVSAREAVDGLPDDSPLRTSLSSLLTEAGDDVDRFRKGLEGWYDDAMDRVSGWYKRRSQTLLLVVGVAFALAVNADSFQIANTLWNNGPVRAAVVTEASAQASRQPSGGSTSQAAGDRGLQTGAAEVSHLEQLKLPIGWSNAKGDPRKPPKLKSWAMVWKLVGILLTGFAISLGAPFWFGLLGRATALRSAGPAPAKAPGAQ